MCTIGSGLVRNVSVTLYHLCNSLFNESGVSVASYMAEGIILPVTKELPNLRHIIIITTVQGLSHTRGFHDCWSKIFHSAKKQSQDVFPPYYKH